MSTRRLLSFIALVLFGFWLPARSTEAATIAWSDLEMRLSHCDIVQAKIERNRVNLAQIEIVVEASPRIFSWKGVGVHALNGKYYEVGTAHGPRDSMLLGANDVMTAKFIQLGKAMFLGIHMGLYELDDLRHLQGGDRVTFTWVFDQCPSLDGWIDPKQLPDWVQPGSTRKLVIGIKPHFGWHPDALLDIHFDPALNIPAQKVDKVVTWKDTFYVTVNLTAPNTAGTDIHFNAWINQRGGDSFTLIRENIRVTTVAPPPAPPPQTPKLVTVPDVRDMTLEQGRKTLASVGLGIAPQGRDPSVAESEQTIYAQMPGKGSQVLEGVKINVSLGMQDYVTPTGFSSLPLVNCHYTTFHLWEFVGDQWVEHEEIPSMWVDGNICPGAGKPIEHTLTDGAWQFYVVVDPTNCKEGNDPRYSACWAADVWIKGDKNGPASPGLHL